MKKFNFLKRKVVNIVMKIFKRNTLISLFIVLSFLISMNFVFAVQNNPLTLPATDLPEDEVEDVIVAAINWLAGIVATVAILMVLGGGVVWVTAGGEEDRVKSARKWIIAGFAGLARVLWSFLTVQVILDLFTVTVTE